MRVWDTVQLKNAKTIRLNYQNIGPSNDKLLCCLCRNFAEVVEHVKGEQGKVVAVTSAERAQAVNDKERPGFFDKIHKVL